MEKTVECMLTWKELQEILSARLGIEIQELTLRNEQGQKEQVTEGHILIARQVTWE